MADIVITEKDIEGFAPYKEKYLKFLADGKRIDLKTLQPAFNELYAGIGYPPPEIIVADSPDQVLKLIQEKSGSDKFYNVEYFLGTQDMYWISWLRYLVDIGKDIPAEDLKNVDIFEAISSQCEWWWPFDTTVFVSQKTVNIKWDDQERLHDPNDLAIKYADGFGVAMWHGQNIPNDWIIKPGALTPEIALKWENVEQRRCAVEILGWDKIVEHLGGGTIIDADPNPEVGTLIELDLPNSGKERFLRVKCGTGRQFSINVPPDVKTAFEAQARIHGFEASEFVLPTRRT